MTYGITHAGNYKVTPQGTTIKSCPVCGKPLFGAKGSKVEELDTDKKVVKAWINNDQRVKYHKACRKEGRRMERQAMKQQKKMNAYVS